ncbi:hypothetical protein [Pedobacter jamesrossensis]|uniref:Zinc-finger n=1 Tax=Pedobacter jamesrossensis TaxID=1908238 RepID=A0ABV8NIA1_9SPHI
MNKLKKIQYNCKKATFLIEKKQIGKITLREKIELSIHLAGCSICKTFEKQSLVINQMVKSLFNSSINHNLKLDEDFKRDLQKRLDEKLS